MKKQSFLRDNGLTIVLMAMFLFSLAGMLLTGWRELLQDLTAHGRPPISLWEFAASGRFVSALFENWESEFLQMGAYVLLTALLFQRGSAESNDPDDPGRPDDEQGAGFTGWLYAHSLSLALGALFLASFVLHWLGSLRSAQLDAELHGEAIPQLWDHLFSSTLWFESFQNWQSEFLSTALLVVLSIFLRHRGSPESKPVQAPHSQTGA
ncbi:MAG TPA: hypothetical protein PLL33_09370 [Paracoccus sp. (in: a-proteobacteria)]|nr:hypothetical protein [Paracoccus sp. (in: a-proteobacteria)]